MVVASEALIDLPVEGEVRAQMLRRAGTRDWERWFDQLERAGHCTNPVRLAATAVRASHDAMVWEHVWTTADEPDGVLLVRCGNRRRRVCPPCSREYKGDVWHLLHAGVAGASKGVPASIATHPMVFATLTAPSFGRVHTTRDVDGRRRRCHPITSQPECPHGQPTWCHRVHGDDDDGLGEPLCEHCYDYIGAVAFNHHAPDLWRRFTITLRRTLARTLGVAANRLGKLVKVSYAKVVEFQRRGVVHYHAIVRLDGPTPYTPPAVTVTAGQLADAVRTAAAVVGVRADLPQHGAVAVRFGAQIDARPITTTTSSSPTAGRTSRPASGPRGALTAEAVAGYIAKYATKAADDFGLGRRLHAVDDLHWYEVSRHIARMVATAFDLADVLGEPRYARWAHMLAYPGHFTTKSRTYSTTLEAIRDERRAFRADRHDRTRRDTAAEQDDGTVVTLWEFRGVGHLTTGDAVLAASAAALARQRDYERHLDRTSVPSAWGAVCGG